MTELWHLILAAFAAGVAVGLIIGPNSGREYSARVDGWISGYRFARRKDGQP